MKIRIALAINTDGDWAAYGACDDTDAHMGLTAMETLAEVANDCSSWVDMKWIEVQIPTPVPLAGVVVGDNAAPCPHVATSDEGTSYCTLAEQTAKLSSNSLVERVSCAIDGRINPDQWLHQDAARAAIRVIAGELRAQCFVHAADWLEQEAER